MKKIIGNVYNHIHSRIKKAFDAIRSERLKLNILQAVPFWIASTITGLIAVFYAKLFTWSEQLSRFIFHSNASMFFLITPVCFVLSWWVVTRFAPYARGSGIPQVIAAIELAKPKYQNRIKQLLSIPVIIVKIISSLIMVIGGAVIGREGPTIQIAGSVFRKINEWLPGWWPKISKRNMIMTGAAAGLAAAFNTPLGGIVFAIEELTKTHISYFKTPIFTAVIIAGLTAQGFLGSYLYLGYPQVSAFSWWIFLEIICVALVAGFLGGYMCRTILILHRWKSAFKFRYQHIIYLVVCALFIAGFAVSFGTNAVGSGKELMSQTLFTNEKDTAWYIPLIRMCGSILSFTAGGAGGIFAPALSAGASIGSFISSWFHLNNSDANVLILCGMVSFLTGVTRSPFTCAILVLEMTDKNNLIFHLMLAGMVAGLSAMVVDKHSLYDHLKNQYIHELSKEEAEIKNVSEPVPINNDSNKH
jgi:H+/Cl- antiporter ClcA